VLVGYNSTRCPGQSSVSKQPVASQTASKFVTFNGNDLSEFLKYRTIFWISLPSKPLSVSYGARSIVTTCGLSFRSVALRYLLGKISSRLMSSPFRFRLLPIVELQKSVAADRTLASYCAPERGAISPSHDYPKGVAFRRGPRLAVRTVARDAV